MAKKPVDDLGKLNSDVLSEFDIDVDQPKTLGRKVAGAAKGVTNILGGALGGAASGVTSEIRNRFPNTAGLVGEAMGVVDDLKSLKSDITQEVAPAWNTMKGITLKMMPMTKLLMPKSLYSKIEKKLKDSYEPEDERSEQQKLDEARTENINQQLSSIFSAQMEMQQVNEAKASAEKQTDRLLERTHFKADQAAFASIDAKLQAANNFLSGAFTAYMKKSLELKYRHLYVANDTFQVVRVLSKVIEARLEEIKHNTGLPEYAKTTFKERLVGSMKQKAADSLVGWGSKLKDKFMGNLREKIMGDLKGFTRNLLPMIASSAGMFSDPDMVGGPLTKSGVLGKALGFLFGLDTSEKTGKFLDKHAGHIGDIEKAMESLKKRLPFMASDKLEALRMSDNPVVRYLMEAMPTRDISTKIDTKTLLKDPNAVVPFDVSTRAAITQVIPSHLERIGNYVEGLARYIAPDLKVNEKTFNYVTQRLSSVKEMQTDLEEYMFSSENRARNMEDSLATTMGLAKDNKRVANLAKDKDIKSLAEEMGTENIEKFFDSEEFRSLQQKFIANMMANQQYFQFDDIVAYVDESKKTDWFNKAFKGLNAREIDAVCKYYITLCAPGTPGKRKRDQVAIDKITDMSLDVLGDTVIDVEMRQMYQRLGAGRHDRWTDAKTGEAVNTAAFYNRRHEDSTDMYQRAEYIASDTKDYRERRRQVEELNAARDDKDTKHYRAAARDMGFGPTADYLPPELVKLIGDAYTKVVTPTIEKVGEIASAIQEKVTGIVPEDSFLGRTASKIKKGVKKVLKANSVEIEDCYMINSNTLHIDYILKDLEGAIKSKGYFEVQSSYGDWTAPTWEEVHEAWVEHERPELHDKLKNADYIAAVKKVQESSSKEDATPNQKWRRERKTGIRTKEVVASDAVVEETQKSLMTTKGATTPSEENYLATFDMVKYATVIDIPSKLQNIIDMMRDSDLFVRSEKHGSSDNASKDDVLIRANEGEMVATKRQQQRMMELINKTLDKDHQLEGQKDLFEYLGIPWNDDDTPLFKRGGRVRKKGGKNKNKKPSNRQRKRAYVSKSARAVAEAIPQNKAITVGNKVADVVDSGVEKATGVVDYAKDKLNDLANTAMGQKVKSGATYIWDKVSGWFTTLKDTIVNRDVFVSKFPEKWRDKIGSAYDSVVSKSNAIGDYFTKIAKDLKLDKAAGKITETLKDAANTITDPTARRHFIISATQQMINIKDTVTDPKKRKEALDKAQKELEELAGKLKNVKTKEKSKGIKGFFRKKWVQAKLMWRKLKQSKFGKWVGGLIDDETKAKIKEDFKSAKDSIKTGWTTMKDKVNDAFGFKKDEKQEDTPDAKNPTPADVASAVANAADKATAVAVDPNAVKTEVKKPEEVKSESGEKVAEGVEKPKVEQPKESKPTTSEKASTPSDDSEKSMFEGEPESRFHADFRSFANRLFSALKNIKIGGGRGKGIIGGVLGGIGKGIGGIARGAATVYGGMLRGVGSAVGGIAKGAGSAISGIAKSGIPSALIKGAGSFAGGLAKGYGSMVGGIFKGVGSAAGGIAKGVGSIFGKNKDSETFGDRARKVGEAIKNFITGSKPKYVDIYLKDQVEAGNPLLTAKQQEEGVYFEDGSKVESSADITKPVFGKKPGSEESQCLITKENIEHGLVDKNNEPLGKKSGSSILDKMGFTGKLLKLGGKIGAGLMDFWGGLLGFGKKGVEAVGKGAKTLIGRLFGIDGYDFSNYHKNVLDRLDRIIVLMGGEPPKGSEVKSGDVKSENKDEVKSIEDKKQEDVKEGLTPTEYPGVYKNKAGKYVDAKGKFVKDPTKQQKQEPAQAPAPTTEVKDESGNQVAEGVSKPSVVEDEATASSNKPSLKDRISKKIADAKDRVKSFFKKKPKDKVADLSSTILVEDGEFDPNLLSLIQSSQKKDPWYKRLFKRKSKGADAKEAAAKDREQDSKAVKDQQTSFFDRIRKREEERKKALEEKKKKQAERDAVNDKAEKEGQARLDKLNQKPGQAGQQQQGGKPSLMDNVKQSLTDRVFGGRNQFGRRTGGLLRGSKAKLLTKLRAGGHKGLARFVAKPGAVTKGLLKTGLTKGAGLLGKGALAAGKGLVGLATNPIGLAVLGAAAAGFSIYKGVKGASKKATKKNLGIKEGVQAQDRVASGLSQALTFGLGGKRAAKFTRKMLDYSPGMAIVKAFMGDKDAMSDKEISIFRAKCENKIKKGMKGYETILAKFNKAVRNEDWPLARSISGNETSLLKTLASPVTNLVKDVGGLLFGDNDKPMKPSLIKAFQKKCQARIQKGDKNAQKILDQFNEAVSEQNWKKARELSGKQAEGLLTKSYSNKALALMGPAFWIIDAFKDPNNKPLTKSEIKETMDFLSKQAAYNPKAKPVLAKFQEAVENEDWKTARKLSGKKGKTFFGQAASVAGKTLEILSGAWLFTTDQEKPLTEKEIQDFRKKMQFRIGKGDSTASRKLEAFDDAISKQNWKKARQISRIKDEAKIVKAAKATWNFLIGSDEEPMSEADQQKFRDSMQRKIKMGDKTAQRKLDAFEDAVGNQKWRRARMIAKMPNDGVLTKAAKAVGSFVAGLFGSDDQAMTELEIKKFRDKMNDEIKGGNKSAQKKLDKFEDAVADQNWRRARAIADTPNKNIVSKALEAAGKSIWSGDEDSAMSEAEVEKFENEMNARIQKGDTGAQKLLDQFHEAVADGLWSKARKISGVRAEGWLKSGLKTAGNWLLNKATFGLFGKSEASAEDVNKLQEEIETENDKDESGLWQKVLDRFMSLKSQGMYQQAYDYGKKMLGSSLSDLKRNAKENKNVDEMEAEVKIQKRQKDVLDNIMKSSKKLGWIGNTDKKRALSILYHKAKFSENIDDDFLNEIEEELTKIDSEAEMTKDSSSYKVDEPLKKMMEAQAKLRDVAVNTRPNVSLWKSPFQWRAIRKLIDELTDTTPDELSEEKLLDWNNRLSEIDGSGVKKITQDDIDKKKQEIEDAKKPQEDTPAAKVEEIKPAPVEPTEEVGVEARRYVDTKPLHSGLFDMLKSKAKSGLSWLKGKASDLYSRMTDGDDLSTDWEGFKHVVGSKWNNVKRYLKNPLKAYQDDKSEREEFMRLMSMPANEAIKEVGAEKYRELRKKYFHEQTQSALSLRDRWTGKSFGAKSGSVISAGDSSESSSVNDQLTDKFSSKYRSGIRGGRTDFSGKFKLKDYYSPTISESEESTHETVNGDNERLTMKSKYFGHVDPKRLRGITFNDYTPEELKARLSGNTSATQDLGGLGDAISQAQRGQSVLGRLYNKMFAKDSIYHDETTHYDGDEEVPWWQFWKKRPLHSGLFDMLKSKANKLKNMAFGKVSKLKDRVSSIISPYTDTLRNLPYEAAMSFDKAGNIFDFVKGSLFGANVAMPKDGTVIHNHPDGSPVSGTDIDSAKSAGVKSMVTITPDSANDSIVKPVSSSVFESISNLGSKIVSHISDQFTRSGRLDANHARAMDKYSSMSKLFGREQQVSEDALSEGASAEEIATRDQTDVLGEKLDRLVDAVYGVKDATVEAGEGVSNRIQNAQNYAIAQSAAYANGAIARTRPKPKEPGLKPASINTERPAFA